MPAVVRRGGAQDKRFLRDMLHHAYYWKERQPDAGPGPVQLYVKAWGRPGDTAVIALLDGFPVGAAWYRLFTRGADRIRVHRRGHARAGGGRRAERTRSRRRQLAAEGLLDIAREDGYAALSLAVDRHNEGAIALYRQFGFVQVAEAPDSFTLRLDLA